LRPNRGETRIVELTNDGLFVNRCQITDALYEMNWDVPKAWGPKAKQGAPNLPRWGIIYIHGWQHSARKGDRDRDKFEKFIRNVHEKRPSDKFSEYMLVGMVIHA